MTIVEVWLEVVDENDEVVCAVQLPADCFEGLELNDD